MIQSSVDRVKVPRSGTEAVFFSHLKYLCQNIIYTYMGVCIYVYIYMYYICVSKNVCCICILCIYIHIHMYVYVLNTNISGMSPILYIYPSSKTDMCIYICSI